MSWKRAFPMASVLAVATVAFTLRSGMATPSASSPAHTLDDATIVAMFDAANSSDIETGELAVKMGSTKTCSTRRSPTEQPLAQPDARYQRLEARVGANRIEEALEQRLAREERIVNRGRALEQCERAALVAEPKVDARRGRPRRQPSARSTIRVRAQAPSPARSCRTWHMRSRGDPASAPTWRRGAPRPRARALPRRAGSAWRYTVPSMNRRDEQRGVELHGAARGGDGGIGLARRGKRETVRPEDDRRQRIELGGAFELRLRERARPSSNNSSPYHWCACAEFGSRRSERS